MTMNSHSLIYPNFWQGRVAFKLKLLLHMVKSLPALAWTDLAAQSPGRDKGISW